MTPSELEAILCVCGHVAIDHSRARTIRLGSCVEVGCPCKRSCSEAMLSSGKIVMKPTEGEVADAALKAYGLSFLSSEFMREAGAKLHAILWPPPKPPKRKVSHAEALERVKALLADDEELADE